MVCRWLPPILAQRVRCWIYPHTAAMRENCELRVRAVTGGCFVGRTGDIHAYPMVVHGYYEWRNVAICAVVCRAGDTVVEVGANIGTETVSFADLVGVEGRVVAYEPDAVNFAALERLAELNGWRHVELQQCAVSAEDGEVWFAATPSREMSGIGHVVRGQEAGATVKVRSIRLDTALEGRAAPVRAIFMDVEGHEVAVLRGAKEVLRRDRPVVVLEASPQLLKRNGWTLGDLAGELKGAGYEFWAIGRFGLQPAELGTRHAGNWLCLPEERRELAHEIQRMLRRAALLPMAAGVNPLARR
jgi:FkbM family methyltransferase